MSRINWGKGDEILYGYATLSGGSFNFLDFALWHWSPSSNYVLLIKVHTDEMWIMSMFNISLNLYGANNSIERTVTLGSYHQNFKLTLEVSFLRIRE